MMDAEKIILTKNFYELSPSEKEAVKDYAQNETDFNEIKSFLMAAQQTFEQQKLQVSENLSQSILNHLHQPVEQKKTWFNALMLFLFPEQKRFYQYPAFQIALASLLILFIINILPGISNDEQLAVNDKVSTTKQEQTTNENKFLENDVFNEVKESENSLNDSKNDNISASNESNMSKEITNQEVEAPEDVNAPLFDVDNSFEDEKTSTPAKSIVEITEVEEAVVLDEVLTVTESTKKSEKKKTKKETHNRVTTAYNSDEINPPVANKKISNNTTVKSISINDTQELLKLFYYSK